MVFSFFLLFLLGYVFSAVNIYIDFLISNFQARLIERTPSMSDLNEVVFGQVRLVVAGYGKSPGICSRLFC
jgi:hypothetical protein